MIPLVDLPAGYRGIRDEVLRAIDEVLSGTRLVLGPNVEALEREFAVYSEVTDCVGVSSGSDALLLALRACGIGEGDEVIVPALTFFATAAAVLHAGAVPVFVDVEESTLTMDPETVRAAIGPRTRALLPVHLYGNPADMEPLLGLAAEQGLAVIEDAAQAHGARYRGRRCGSLGTAGCFSFYVTKNLGAYGEAGCVTTTDAAIADRVRSLRNHGHADKRTHTLLGHNARLDEVQAAVLRIKLRRLDASNARRREIAARYRMHFAGSLVRGVAERCDGEPVHHLFPLRVENRDGLMSWLEGRGIGTGTHYAVPVHRQVALAGRPHRVTDLPVSERACRQLLSIPMYPELTDDQVDRVAGEVLAFPHLEAERRRA